MLDLNALMRKVIELQSPDLHLHAGMPPIVRKQNGNLMSLDQVGVLDAAQIQEIINQITNDEQKERFTKELELDFSYQIENLSRFRVNAYEERKGPGLAFRVINETVPTLEELGLQVVGHKVATMPYGLILITGTTGSGKSTTMASIVDYINSTHNVHIISIEDPIEFVFKPKSSLITQREISVHSHSFPQAIRAAMRQDPDVVMVGEMRDLETIAAAITLAETGHLVFSTLHTADTAQTIDRIIDVFPPYQQAQIRSQLANVLKAVISQTLIPTADGKNRVAAREIMFATDAVRNCIAKGEVHQIYTVIQTGAEEEMVLMDRSLADLVAQGHITHDIALMHARDRESFQSLLDQHGKK